MIIALLMAGAGIVGTLVGWIAYRVTAGRPLSDAEIRREEREGGGGDE